MKTYRLDFNLEAWIQHLEIEADSEEEAKEKLYKMTLEEILEEGAIVEDTAISDIDCEVISADYKIHVSHIEYDITEDDVEYTNLTVEQVVETLPTELDIEVSWHTWDDLEDLIVDELSDKTGYMIADYTYTILNK